MALEDLTGDKYIDALDSANPVGTTDFVASVDDHMRGVKNVLKKTFPNLNGAVTASPAELNKLDGLLASKAELDVLDGAGITTAELTKLAGGSGAIAHAGDAFVKTAGDITLNDNIALRFGTGGVEADLESDGTNLILNLKTDKDFYINDDSTTRFLFDGSAGDLHADGDIIAFSTSVGSDPKLKESIYPIEDALDKVTQLKGYTFNWIKNGREDAGLLANELQLVLPEVVRMGGFDAEQHMVVNYNGVVGLLVQAINELLDRVEILEESL